MKLERKPGHKIVGLARGYYAKSLDPRADRCGWCIVCCPDCGRLMTLGRNHVVAPDGGVSPSLVCPHNGCGFHNYITLAGW